MENSILKINEKFISASFRIVLWNNKNINFEAENERNPDGNFIEIGEPTQTFLKRMPVGGISLEKNPCKPFLKKEDIVRLTELSDSC